MPFAVINYVVLVSVHFAFVLLCAAFGVNGIGKAEGVGKGEGAERQTVNIYGRMKTRIYYILMRHN